MTWTKISASIRLIMAMFQLQAGVEESFGRGVKDLLKRMYPDQKDGIQKGITDNALGQKLMAIALKQNQYDQTRAEDAVQNFLVYLSGGGKEGDPANPYNYAKNFDNWEDALDALYSNLRNRAMSESMGTFKRKKREKSVDDAYGTRGDGGGAPEGGEGRMPTPDDTALGQALDDKAGIKEFIDLIDEHIGDLKGALPEDERKLFDLIFDDGIGSFGSDIKENMSQATALKEKYPDLFTKNQKRWSGFVGDLRKKLLDSIWKFIDKHLSQSEYNVLRETFFADVSPDYVRRKEKEKGAGKLEYQQGIDERKLAKWKWMEQQGSLPEKEKASYDNLAAKLKKQGIDVDSIPATESPVAKGWTLHSKRAASAYSMQGVADRVARVFSAKTGT